MRYGQPSIKSALKILRDQDLAELTVIPLFPQFSVTTTAPVEHEPWLQPYTDKTLIGLPAQGVRRVQVACPGFAVDWLETLEEIAMQNREFFIDAGGESLEYIPSLNDSPAHVEVMLDLVQ